MRVIAGSARGRRLAAVPGLSVRPTADRVKEAVFSMLVSRFGLHEARILDLYAGSGALGIEALSRGAAAVVFVDRHAAAVAVVRRNLAACGFTGRLLAMPAQKALARLEEERAEFDGVFLDPPYASDEAAQSLVRLGRSALLAPGAWVALEHAGATPMPERCGVLGLILTKGYGNTHVAVYRRDE